MEVIRGNRRRWKFLGSMKTAGGGKPTLLVIIDHPQTENALRIWAGKNTLIVVTFHFLISGSVG